MAGLDGIALHKNTEDRGLGFGLLLYRESLPDRVHLRDDVRVVDVLAKYCAQHLSCFFRFAPAVEPTRRLRQPEDQDDYKERKENLEGDWQPPGDRTAGIADAKVEPVGKHDSHSNKEDLSGDKSASVGTVTKL